MKDKKLAKDIGLAFLFNLLVEGGVVFGKGSALIVADPDQLSPGVHHTFLDIITNMVPPSEMQHYFASQVVATWAIAAVTITSLLSLAAIGFASSKERYKTQPTKEIKLAFLFSLLVGGVVEFTLGSARIVADPDQVSPGVHHTFLDIITNMVSQSEMQHYFGAQGVIDWTLSAIALTAFLSLAAIAVAGYFGSDKVKNDSGSKINFWQQASHEEYETQKDEDTGFWAKFRNANPFGTST